MKPVILSILSFIIIFSGTLRLEAQVVSTFDTDLEGWRIIGDNSAIWQSTGGNPGGCLDVNDAAIGSTNYASAPNRFLGDWSAFTTTDSVFFDIYEVNTSGGAWINVHQVRIEGPGGAAWANDPAIILPAPQSAWIHVRVMTDPADWTLESGTWEGLLANVTSLRIMAEWIDGGETTWLDNIGISRVPAPPAGGCLDNTFTAEGLGDWSFVGAGTVTNPGAGGNGGGFLQIADKSGANSYGLAASMFLGDWSSYEGAGFVTLDIRIPVSSGTNGGSPDFLRISGPGGAAHVSLDTLDLIMPPRVWKTFSFPVEESAWALESGTWGALISNITECRVDLEYFVAGETVGLDNFGLRMDYCPPIDDLVDVTDPALGPCGVMSLVGISTVALNPMDGELYGLVRATSGGLCRVTGTEAGIFLATYSDPAHLIFAPNGDAFITEDYSGYVYRKAWGGSSSLWVAGFHSGDDDVYGMTIAPPGFDGPNVNPGDILVSDRGYSGADEIWSFSPAAAEGELLVMPDPGNVDQYDLCAGGNDTVYVADALDGGHLYVLEADGSLGSLVISPPLSAPYSIVYDSQTGAIFIADGATESVHRVDPHTGSSVLAASGFRQFSPCCLEIDAPGRRLYVADTGCNRVYEICLETVTAAEEPSPVATSLAFRAWPNPFNPTVILSYALAAPSRVRVDIFDAGGRLVRSLIDEKREAGCHSLSWNGRNETGAPGAAGIYFARIEALGKTETRKLVLLR